MENTTPPTLTPTNLPEILARYAQGESLNTLAVEAKTNRSTIYRWMLSGIGDKDFGELVTSCLINRIAESDEKLETATDSCNVARAREMARFSRMDLERRRPHLYGPKTEVKQDTQITVIVQRQMADPLPINGVDRVLTQIGTADAQEIGNVNDVKEL